MATDNTEAYRDILTLLGRAAGLSTLALATLASGPCGTCTTGDECATVDDLVDVRTTGIDESASAGAAGASGEAASYLAIAREWDGASCPTAEQYHAIVRLKFPSRYSDASVAVTDLGNGKCCYHIVGNDCGQGGRPFLVHGRPRLASLANDSGAQAPTSEALAQDWLADAQMEHASVAAFARLSLHLLALGAPAELVRDAQQASLDELRHADFFFELASRPAGPCLRPGPLQIAGALDDLSLTGLVESNLLEGCIGETLAAAHLRRRAGLVGDPSLKAALLEIADDETRHGALAFRILRWCRDVAPELTRQAVQRVLKAQPSQCDDAGTWQHVLSPLLGAMC